MVTDKVSTCMSVHAILRVYTQRAVNRQADRQTDRQTDKVLYPPPMWARVITFITHIMNVVSSM